MGGADAPMQRLVLTHDLLQRKVLKDARSSRQAELVPGIATQIDQPSERVRHGLALARRHDDAVRPDHPAAVADVGGDAWHPLAIASPRTLGKPSPQADDSAATSKPATSAGTSVRSPSNDI